MSAQRGLKDKKGFTLIELMVAMAVSLIIIAAIFGVYETMNKSNLSIKASSDMQQNVRTAVDSITKMMVNAGYQGQWNNILGNHSTAVDGLVYQRASYDNSLSAPNNTGVVSGPNSICFTYYDDNHVFSSGSNGEWRVQIYMDSADQEILANFEQFNTTSTLFGPAANGWSVVLARGISNLRFQYYNADDNDITSSLSSQSIGTVRKITVTVTGKTSFAQFISNGFRSFSLSTDVTPVNLGIAGHIVDAYPPATPTGLYVSDPHTCTKLTVQWNANKEVDLAGYTIFYGIATGKYDHRVDVGTVSNNGICTYTLPPPGETLNAGTEYYITIGASNTSGLMSNPLATEVSTGVVTPGIGTNQTTPTEYPPSAPVVMAAAGPGDGAITLTWTGNPSNEGVTSYRVYRMSIPNPSSPPAFSYPIPDTPEPANPAPGVPYRVDTGTTGNKPVTQVVLNNNQSGFQFKDYGLQGCTMYEYAVCGVNCTQSATGPISSPYSSAQYCTLYGGSYTDSNGVPHTISSPVAGEVTKPTDGTPPPPPTDLVGIPGSKVVDLSWTNPTGDPDFQGVMIRRSTGGYPASPTDGTLVYNDYSSAAGQSCTYHDTGVADTDPPTCYYYSAFSYNKCGIYNSTAVESLNFQGASTPACSQPCSSALYGEPPAPPMDKYSMSYCADKVNLGWQDPSNLTSYPDFTGYDIYRSDNGSTPIQSNYKSSNTNVYSDTTYIQSPGGDGGVYSYHVRTTDCSGGLSNATSIVTLTAYPGQVLYDPSAVNSTNTSAPNTPHTNITVSTGMYHNTLIFDASNTSSHEAELDGMTLTWKGGGTETNAMLTGVSIYDPTQSKWVLVYNNSSGGVSTDTPIVFNANTPFYIPQTTNGIGSEETVPMQFTWENADGTVSSSDDMRNALVTITFNYRLFYYSSYTSGYLLSDPTLAGCSPVVYNVVQAAGPNFMDVTQSQPLQGTFAETQLGYLTAQPGQTTDVSSYVTDTSPNLAGIQYVHLFYAVTARDITAPPAVGSAPDNINLKSSVNPSGYTCITTVPANTGNYVQYETSFTNSSGIGTNRPIPAFDNSRIWYFLVAKDNNGNFTRWPAPSSPDAIYTYDQLGGGGNTATTVSVKITSPATGSTITSYTTATLATTDTGSGVTNVMVNVDGGSYQSCSYDSSTGLWDFVIDPAIYSNGTHTLNAVATTADYHSATDSITFNVVGGSGTTSVSASIASPASGATVSGTQVIQVQSAATGAPAGGITVSVNIGGTIYPCTYNISDGYYEYSWDTTHITNNSSVSISATATYIGSNATSSPISVTVNNASGNLPSVSIVSPASGGLVTGSTTLQIEANPNGGIINSSAGVQASYDNVNWTPCPYNSADGYYEQAITVTPPVACKSYTIYVYATSTNGRSTTVQETFYVDTTSAVSCTIQPPANPVATAWYVGPPSNAQATIGITTGTDGDAIGGVTVSIDGGTPIAATGSGNSWSYVWNIPSSDSNTSHTVSATATTVSCTGKSMIAAATPVTFNVGDVTPPTVSNVQVTYTTKTGSQTISPGTSSSSPGSIPNNTTLTITATVTDTGGSGVAPGTVKLYDNNTNGSGLAATSYSGGVYTWDNVPTPTNSNASYVFNFDAADTAGNLTMTPNYYTVTQ